MNILLLLLSSSSCSAGSVLFTNTTSITSNSDEKESIDNKREAAILVEKPWCGGGRGTGHHQKVAPPISTALQEEEETEMAWLGGARKLVVSQQDDIRHKIFEQSSLIYSTSSSITTSTSTSKTSDSKSSSQLLVPPLVAHRQLELSKECLQELRQIEAANNTFVPITDNSTIFNITESDVKQYCSINVQKRTITCDYMDLFKNSTEAFQESCQNAGGVIDYFRMKIFYDDLTFAGGAEPVTIVFNNIPSCVGPSCVRDEYIQYVQVFLDQQQNSSNTTGDGAGVLYGYSIEFSAAAGYYRHRGVAVGGSSTIILLVLITSFVTAAGMLVV